MKLKPIVASMLLIGAANIAFAGDINDQDLNALKAKVSKLEAVLDANQGQVYSYSQVPFKDSWEKYVSLSGMMNFEAYHANRYWGSIYGNVYDPSMSTAFPTAGNSWDHSSNQVGLSNAVVFVDAKPNCWVNFHLAMSYWGNLTRAFSNAGAFHALAGGQGVNEAGYTNRLQFDEAYATVGDLSRSPLYVRAGRQWLPFGNFDPYAITASLTQLLSQDNQEALLVGAASPVGVSGSFYMFNGNNTQTGFATADTTRHNLNGWGARLAYGADMNNVSMHANLDYINDIYSNDYIGMHKGMVNGQVENIFQRLPAWNAHLCFGYMNFDLAGDYVWAAKKSDARDMVFNSAVLGTVGSEARPRVWGVKGGYSFDTVGMPSRVGVMYNRSAQAAALAIPKTRFGGDYRVTIGRATDVTFQVYKDTGYNEVGVLSNNYPVAGNTNAATISNNNSVTNFVLNLGVKFA